MKTIAKIFLVSASVISMGALTACQSTNNMSDRDGRYAKKMDKKHERFTSEQREQMKQMRAQRTTFYKQTKKACDKQAVGSTIQIKVGEQTIQGTCDIRFYPERTMNDKSKYTKEYRSSDKHMMHSRHNDSRYNANAHREMLTDTKRSEMVKQYEQRLAEKQAIQNALSQACNGKTTGQKVKIKLGEREMNGQCLVKFKPMQTTQATTQPTI